MDMKDERGREGGTRERGQGEERSPDGRKKEKGGPYWLLDLHPLNLKPWGSIIGVFLQHFYLNVELCVHLDNLRIQELDSKCTSALLSLKRETSAAFELPTPSPFSAILPCTYIVHIAK